MLYIRKFDNHEEYENFVSGDTMVRPNVSRCMEDNDVHYNPKTFYVYHTSDCTIEKITVADNVTDFDIMSLVKSGYTYGGYFGSYGQSGETAAAILNGDDVEFVDGFVTDISGTSYIGDYVSTSTTEVIGYFSEPYLESGTSMNPKDEEMYFLNEDGTCWLENNRIHLYVKATSAITDFYMFSDLPSLNYNSIKFVLINENDSTRSEVNMNVAKTVTINGTKYTVRKLFGGFGVAVNRGYLAYVNVMPYLQENTSYIVYPIATTPDGVEVEGVKYRYTFDTLTVGGYSSQKISE